MTLPAPKPPKPPLSGRIAPASPLPPSARPGRSLPLREVLARAADEAWHVHDGLAGLDISLGEALGHLPPEIIATLQETDLLRQEAEGLAIFLARLAQDVAAGSGCDPVPALSLLLLRDQACRLAGAPDSAAGDHASEIWSSGPG